ncbi:glyoxalase [Dokdonia sp. Hel_I_53]|uniref:glyoxalase n=1 Tax=Dokdonia sp. Hel_I_53 TaxID=1566287 RepID=UPI001198EF45|nr:glyoxalase [Dokdonia sp. Hel_I_53]TVZ52230.1 hypothetical protein OD90_1400 [Dokdonia sp. Hel_I_53]
MNLTVGSIRPFIGARDYKTSRAFYNTIGFEEKVISRDMSIFKLKNCSFYLQDAYVKDWIDNSMIFLEVIELDEYLAKLKVLDLPSLFKGVRISEIVKKDWGREFFLHDPSGILWHIGSFY